MWAQPSLGVWRSVGDSALPRDFGLGVPGSAAEFDTARIENVGTPAAARSPAGLLFVAWEQQRLDSGGGPLPRQIHLRAWDGTSWQALGTSASAEGVSNAPRDCSLPDLDFDDSGHPVVAWVVEGTGGEGPALWSRRWTGTAWEEVFPGSATGSGVYQGPTGSTFTRMQLRLDASPGYLEWAQGVDYGQRIMNAGSSPILIPGGLELGLMPDVARAGTDRLTAQAASVEPGGQQVFVGRNGAFTAFNVADYAYANPQAAIDAAGNAAIVWGTPLPGFSGSTVAARVWNGASFVTLGATVASPLDTSSNFDLTLDTAGNPVFSLDRFLYRWNGAAWVESPATEFGAQPIHHGPVTLSQDPSGDATAVWGALGHVYAGAWRDAGFEGLGMELTGGLSRSGQTSQSPIIGLDASGELTVVWANGFWSTVSRLAARRWTGTAWENLGFSPASPEGIEGFSGFPSAAQMAIDPHGQPALTWLQRSGATTSLRVRRWSGTAWDQLGGGAVASGTAAAGLAAPCVAFDAEAAPVIAWNQNGGGIPQVFVRRLSAGAWQEMPTGSATGAGLSQATANCSPPTLASRAGTLAIAWREATAPESRHRIYTWSGLTWTGVGAFDGAVANPENAQAPKLVIDGLGQPAFAALSGNSLIVRRWDGAQWVTLPSLAFPSLANGVTPLQHAAGPLQPTDFALSAGAGDDLLVAVSADRLRVARWDGAAWTEVGTGSFEDGLQILPPITNVSRRLSLVADPLGNPVVAYQCFGEVFLLSAGPGLSTPGSANGDTLVDITDVVRAVNHINGDLINYPPAFNNADMDDDGDVDQSDLTEIGDLLLGVP